MRPAPAAGVQQAIATALGHDVSQTARARWSAAGHSAINDTRRLDVAGLRYFVKLAPVSAKSMFEAEADGLDALRACNALRVPRVVGRGSTGDHAWLVLEWLDLERGGRDAKLGRALAALHRITRSRFGWHRDNTIGTTPQANACDDDWARFFGERRLAPQLALAAANGHADVARAGDRLLPRVAGLLAGHAPVASLLHGDLWSGNAAQLVTGEPAIFDPATYYGDREADLAMTELFGGFEASFHAAYQEAWPVDSGYATRRTLYNLYHVLNHLNLFGSGYAAQAREMMARLMALA